MNNDGTKSGFAIDILNVISTTINIPVIASGGAGKMAHFKEVFLQTRVSGALAASVFHYGEIAIPDLKVFLEKCGIEVRI